MESPAHNPASARSRRWRASWVGCSRPAAFMAVTTIALLVVGCGGRVVPTPRSSSLVTGERAVPIPPGQLASATSAARAFARSWIPTIYLRRPPRLPLAGGAVRREQLLAAARVPANRRRLQPRVASEALQIVGPDRVRLAIRVVDGHSPAFSLGAVLIRRGRRWMVISISTPG